jgi:hypothetical protein
VPSTTIVVSFPHIPSQHFCNKFKLSFTFIDLFLQVHLHHIFILISFAILLGQFNYIYNLGETGCYINARSNQCPLQERIMKEQPDILLLQETKCVGEEASQILTKCWKQAKMVEVDAKGAARGLIVL